MPKLVCDRCGREIKDEAEIDQIVAGADAWIASVRARGAEPRGIYPCKDYIRCGGEMVIIEK
jgi:hypothetical protein